MPLLFFSFTDIIEVLNTDKDRDEIGIEKNSQKGRGCLIPLHQQAG